MKIGILSDAHGHLGAFEVAVAALREAGAERLFFLGDAVGYIPEAGVVERIRTLSIPAIRGNHEAMLLSGTAVGDQEDIYRLNETQAQMDETLLDFIASWPPSLSEMFGGLRCLFVHGSPSDPTFDYVYPDTHLGVFADVDADVVFMGHTHRPFVRRHVQRLFVNVGSCGLPRDDDPRGAACLFDLQSGQAHIIRFSIAHASRAVLAHYSLAPSVAARLERFASTVRHA